MENNLGFPSDFLPRSRKVQKEYGIMYARAIYNKYIHNNSDFQARRERYILNKLYAEGLQDENLYKETFQSDDSEGDTSYLNLDYSIVSAIPVFIDLLVGEFTNQKYRVRAEAIDQMSLDDKDFERARLVSMMRLKPVGDLMKEKLGIDPFENEPFMPSSMDEIDLHREMNHKLSTEIVTEEMIKFVYDQNKKDEICRKLYLDFVLAEKGAFRCYINENDDIVVRHVNVENLIHPPSTEDDFSDCHFAAEILLMPIHKLRRLDRTLSEEKLFEIAKSSVGRNDNPTEWSYGKYVDYMNHNDTYGGYDDFMIEVLDFQFISIDIKTFEEKPNNYGGMYFNEKGFGYKSDNKEKKVYTKELEFKYGGMWIVGTECILNYGLKEDILRKKTGNVYSSETELDYIIFSAKNKSLVERMIPHANQIQLVSLKMQQLIAKLRPPGKEIDLDALENVLIGKMKTSDPLKIIEFYDQTGILFYRGKDDEGNYANRPPSKDNKDSMGQQLNDLITTFNFHRDQLRNITGLNEMRDGMSASNDTPVYVQQNVLKASRNATRLLTDAFRNVYTRTAQYISIYVSDLIQQGRIDNYKNILGKLSVDLLKLNKDMELAEIGITLQALPSDEDVASFEELLKTSLAQKELKWEDAMIARDYAKESIKKATQFVSLKRRQYFEQEMQSKQQDVQNNAMAQQQSNQQASENESALMDKKHQMELEKIKAETEAELIKINLKYDREKELRAIDGDIEHSYIQHQSDENYKNKALESAISSGNQKTL